MVKRRLLWRVLYRMAIKLSLREIQWSDSRSKYEESKIDKDLAYFHQRTSILDFQ